MRDRTERTPNGFAPEPFDYSFKFSPNKLPPALNFMPHNLNYEPEMVTWQGV